MTRRADKVVGDEVEQDLIARSTELKESCDVRAAILDQAELRGQKGRVRSVAVHGGYTTAGGVPRASYLKDDIREQRLIRVCC